MNAQLSREKGSVDADDVGIRTLHEELTGPQTCPGHLWSFGTDRWPTRSDVESLLVSLR